MTDDVGRIQRSLLQEDVEDLESLEEEELVTTTTTTTTEGPLENMAGPTRFYCENGKLPKFLMEVSEGKVESCDEASYDVVPGIRLTLYKEGRLEDRFVLDKEAKGGISGSRISNDLDSEQQKDDYRVRD